MRCTLSRIATLVGLTVAEIVLLPAADAQIAGQATSGGAPSEVQLRVNVMASVSASCAFSAGDAPIGTYSVGDVEQAYAVNITFSLHCNSPSRVGIVSDNGGLQAVDVPRPPPGYARLAPYRITLRLVGDAGSTAEATCDSPTIVAGAAGCVFRGPATSRAGLRLPGPSGNAPGSFIRVSSDGYADAAPLVASNAYVDRLTVTISPAT